MERNIELGNLAVASWRSGRLLFTPLFEYELVNIMQCVCLQKSVRRRLLEHCADLLSSVFT